MQLLAVRLADRRDPDDAIVLGDALRELDVNGLITGRVRPVVFRLSPSANVHNSDGQTTFLVPGRESIHNVPLFASQPTREEWGKIWTMWFTSRRDIYRALVNSRVLPRSVKFHEIVWRPLYGMNDNTSLAYNLYVSRVPPRRKKPVETYLFRIERWDNDNPQTNGQHFDESHQLRLL